MVVLESWPVARMALMTSPILIDRSLSEIPCSLATFRQDETFGAVSANGGFRSQDYAVLPSHCPGCFSPQPLAPQLLTGPGLRILVGHLRLFAKEYAGLRWGGRMVKIPSASSRCGANGVSNKTPG